MVQYHTDGAFEPLDRNFSCIIGAFITAHSRVVLHKAINVLDLRGCIITYTDTDALLYLRRMFMANPLPNIHSTKIGGWKNEMPDSKIVRATFVGPKNYCLVQKHNSSRNKMLSGQRTLLRGKRYSRITKVRGFSLKQSKACQAIEIKNMKKMVLEKMGYWKWSLRKRAGPDVKNRKEAFPNGVALLVPQSTIITKNKYDRQLITKKWNKLYANQISAKRACLYQTLQLMRREGILGQNRVENSQFINCMKYFTMPFSFAHSDVLLLKDKFVNISKPKEE
jgi:hypothetical protein